MSVRCSFLIQCLLLLLYTNKGLMKTKPILTIEPITKKKMTSLETLVVKGTIERNNANRSMWLLNINFFVYNGTKEIANCALGNSNEKNCKGPVKGDICYCHVVEKDEKFGFEYNIIKPDARYSEMTLIVRTDINSFILRDYSEAPRQKLPVVCVVPVTTVIVDNVTATCWFSMELRHRQSIEISYCVSNLRIPYTLTSPKAKTDKNCISEIVHSYTLSREVYKNYSFEFKEYSICNRSEKCNLHLKQERIPYLQLNQITTKGIYAGQTLQVEGMVDTNGTNSTDWPLVIYFYTKHEKKSHRTCNVSTVSDSACSGNKTQFGCYCTVITKKEKYGLFFVYSANNSYSEILLYMRTYGVHKKSGFVESLKVELPIVCHPLRMMVLKDEKEINCTSKHSLKMGTTSLVKYCVVNLIPPYFVNSPVGPESGSCVRFLVTRSYLMSDAYRTLTFSFEEHSNCDRSGFCKLDFIRDNGATQIQLHRILWFMTIICSSVMWNFTSSYFN